MLTYPPDLEEYVQAKIASGKFRNPDEFAVEAARLYRDMELRQRQLKSDIQAAIDEIERGECEPLDIEEIIAELDEELDEYGRPR